MGYSPAAMQGVKDNGRGWKKTITGLTQILDQMRVYVEEENIEQIDASLRKIHTLFKSVWNETKASSGETEALEWFAEESAQYEYEQDSLDEWIKEFDYRLGELYDYADYNRIWVAP